MKVTLYSKVKIYCNEFSPNYGFCMRTLQLFSKHFKKLSFWYSNSIRLNLKDLLSKMIGAITFQSCTGNPCILWFHNLWSPLFRDSVSGLNFVNSSPLHDFKKIKEKKIRNFFDFFFHYLFVVFSLHTVDCIWWILRFPC